MTYTKASGADGGTHVAAAPLTTEATKEIVPDLLTSAIDQRITRIRPASTPLDPDFAPWRQPPLQFNEG